MENKTVKRHYVMYELLLKGDIPVTATSPRGYSSREQALEEAEKVKSMHRYNVLNTIIVERVEREDK